MLDPGEHDRDGRGGRRGRLASACSLHMRGKEVRSHNLRKELLWLDNSLASYIDADAVLNGVYERVYLHLAPPARHLAHPGYVYCYVLRLLGGLCVALGVQLDAPGLAHRVYSYSVKH